MSTGHAHQHAHGTPSSTASVITVALVLNTVLAVGQVVAGALFGSIALIADSAHQVVDVLGLGIALVGVRLASRGVTERNTFGWARADVLGALASSTLLLVSTAWITYEAIRRLTDPHGIEGWPVLVVALVGLFVNAGSAVALARAEGSMATRAAVVHLVGDAAGSAGVLVSAVAVIAADAAWVDPLVALAIAAWVGWTGWSLLRSSARLLLDVVPVGLSADAVADTILEVDGVVAVHHLHLWEPAPDDPSVSAHVVVDGDMVVHESQALLDLVRDRLHDVHGIAHATFEVECHPCEDAEHGVARVGADEGE
ncbi:cation diffusion facilitator family transporter [Actinomarinicola tropica]|uniref:Cation diffusion facilitator family transporter n=1 Tax=Actinomarinicola tropica TaxID=2789776 RepID=A0A5Q2RMQ0_9ACTN|nr:cation diffusion facilitator family transporter [Actinomarinicola tropica]QGG96754.1 cation diffusion facilitator family transporter [Actinomarinicola tropica]